MPAKPRSVQLVGGPYDGRWMITIGSGTIVVDDVRTPDGVVARYRPSSQPDRYTFRGLATVLTRTPERAA